MSQVRELVAQHLDGSPASDDAVLLASELAANACAHSASGEPGGQFVVRLCGGGSSCGEVYVEVEDQGSAWDGLLKETESPHGLYLLRELAAACGTRPGASGWITWFVVGETAEGTMDTREDPLDPERILRVLPEQERGTFLAQYQRAVHDAQDPAGWKNLQRFLRLGTGGGMALEDALRHHRPSS